MKLTLPFSPRGYQQKASENIQEVYNAGHRQFIWTGATGCITGDTIINFNRCKKGFKMEIEKAYNHSNKIKGKQWKKEFPTYVRSFNGENILLHEIENIVYSGIKDVFKLTLENGLSIKATEDHNIMTIEGFKELIYLKPNHDHIMIDENKPTGTKDKSKKERDKSYSVGKHHPYGNLHKSKSRTRVSYTIEIHRAIYEAYINCYSSVDYFLDVVKSGKTEGMIFVNPKTHVIHHKDGNHHNNKIDNLQMVTHSEHNII